MSGQDVSYGPNAAHDHQVCYLEGSEEQETRETRFEGSRLALRRSKTNFN
jgi:hypothetical protein